MPTYTFKNTETNEEWTDRMSISEKEKFLEENPHIKQLITKALSIGDSWRLGRTKPPDSFRDVLREVKKAHPLGKGVNTF